MKKLTPESQAALRLSEKFGCRPWAFAPVVLGGGGYGLGVAVAGEPGYYPIPAKWCRADSYEDAAQHAEELNAAHLDPDEAAEIVASSMRAGAKPRGASNSDSENGR